MPPTRSLKYELFRAVWRSAVRRTAALYHVRVPGWPSDQMAVRGRHLLLDKVCNDKQFRLGALVSSHATVVRKTLRTIVVGSSRVLAHCVVHVYVHLHQAVVRDDPRWAFLSGTKDDVRSTVLTALRTVPDPVCPSALPLALALRHMSPRGRQEMFQLRVEGIVVTFRRLRARPGTYTVGQHAQQWDPHEGCATAQTKVQIKVVMDSHQSALVRARGVHADWHAPSCLVFARSGWPRTCTG